MINNKKVRLMTNLAIYEKNNESDLKISKYYKWDYVRFNMIKTILNVTFAYVLILILLLIYNCEELVAQAFNIDYVGMGLKVIIGYFVLLCSFSAISVFVYSEKYKNAKERLLKYYKKLKLLEKMCNEEKRKS